VTPEPEFDDTDAPWVPRLGGPGHLGPGMVRGAAERAPVLPLGHFAVFAGYTAVLLIVGGILFRRLDA
jgi:hypothetical protein